MKRILIVVLTVLTWCEVAQGEVLEDRELRLGELREELNFAQRQLRGERLNRMLLSADLPVEGERSRRQQAKQNGRQGAKTRAVPGGRML